MSTDVQAVKQAWVDRENVRRSLEKKRLSPSLERFNQEKDFFMNLIEESENDEPNNPNPTGNLDNPSSKGLNDNPKFIVPEVTPAKDLLTNIVNGTGAAQTKNHLKKLPQSRERERERDDPTGNIKKPHNSHHRANTHTYTFNRSPRSPGKILRPPTSPSPSIPAPKAGSVKTTPSNSSSSSSSKISKRQLMSHHMSLDLSIHSLNSSPSKDSNNHQLSQLSHPSLPAQLPAVGAGQERRGRRNTVKVADPFIPLATTGSKNNQLLVEIPIPQSKPPPLPVSLSNPGSPDHPEGAEGEESGERESHESHVGHVRSSSSSAKEKMMSLTRRQAVLMRIYIYHIIIS